MQQVYEFLKKVGTYYIATVCDNKPKVRPFGTILLYENKLYIQTGKGKDFTKQLAQNNNVELCAFNGGEWLRLSGELILDERVQVQEEMLNNYSQLRSMYTVGENGNTAVFYFKNATATIYSFTKPPVITKF